MSINELKTELNLSAKEIFRLRRELANNPRVPVVETQEAESQTAEPLEPGEYLTQSLIARLSISKNQGKAYTKAMDLLNKSRRWSKKILCRTFVRGFQNLLVQRVAMVFQALTPGTDVGNVRALVFIKAWRNLVIQGKVARSEDFENRLVTLRLITKEFRLRLLNFFVTKRFLTIRKLEEFLISQKSQAGAIWSASLFSWQKERFLCGEEDTDDQNSKLPCPFYLKKYREKIFNFKLSQLTEEGCSESSIELSFPLFHSAVPAFIFEVLRIHRNNTSDDNENTSFLLLDALTFFFSNWNEN